MNPSIPAARGGDTKGLRGPIQGPRHAGTQALSQAGVSGGEDLRIQGLWKKPNCPVPLTHPHPVQSGKKLSQGSKLRAAVSRASPNLLSPGRTELPSKEGRRPGCSGPPSPVGAPPGSLDRSQRLQEGTRAPQQVSRLPSFPARTPAPGLHLATQGLSEAAVIGDPGQVGLGQGRRRRG